jgi:glycosyltransferase involved in cell wall biosynthesis
MIWLVTYPRSGTTFFRNLLYDVYGIESSTFHTETTYPVDKDYDKYPVVKTHLLPDQLVPNDPKIPVVYLVRDGRDTIVSMAHQREDYLDPSRADFLLDVQNAILAQGDTYFGGWSKHVDAWLPRASVVIRFEDLVRDPIGQMERIRPFMPSLPKPDPTKVPTFESQKFGKPRYGSKALLNVSEEEKQVFAKKFFRKGKAGGWKEELPIELSDLFWNYHGLMSSRLGYTYSGEITTPDSELEWNICQKIGISTPSPKRKYKVIIECNQLMLGHTDGCKRYLLELLRNLKPTASNPHSKWHFDLYIKGKIVALKDYDERNYVKETLRQNDTHQKAIEGYNKQIRELNLEIEKVDHELRKLERKLKSLALRRDDLQDERDIIVDTLAGKKPKLFVPRTTGHTDSDIEEIIQKVQSSSKEELKTTNTDETTLKKDEKEAKGIINRIQSLLDGRTTPEQNHKLRWYLRLAERILSKTEKRQLYNQLKQYDAVHFTVSLTAFPFNFLPNIRFITTVHDLTPQLFPHYHTDNIVNHHVWHVLKQFECGAHFIGISEATINDLVLHYNTQAADIDMTSFEPYQAELFQKALQRTNLTPDKVSLVYEAADMSHFRKVYDTQYMQYVRQKYNLPTDGDYLMTLSTLEPRKNLLNTIKAFKRLCDESPHIDLKLVIAGKRGWKIDELFESEHLASDRIFFTGYVEEADLPALLSGALALVYVSFYEGFGLPPLEAMSCGTPVIYGNNSSLAEIIADDGYPADAYDINSIKDQMRLVYENVHHRVAMQGKAWRKSFQFTWRKCALETLAVYERQITNPMEPRKLVLP